jgi:hypothetical protein
MMQPTHTTIAITLSATTASRNKQMENRYANTQLELKMAVPAAYNKVIGNGR